MIASQPLLTLFQHQAIVLARRGDAVLCQMGFRFVLWREAGVWHYRHLETRFGSEPEMALDLFLLETLEPSASTDLLAS